MIDAATHEQVRVYAEGDAAPYIIVTLAQLDAVRAILDRQAIAYWVDTETISVNGKPEVAFINLTRNTNPAAAQRALDNAA